MNPSKQKIKLLIVVPTLECGGLERNISILCNHINTDKFDVTLAVLNNGRQFFPITNSQVKLLDLRINHVRNALFAIRKLSRKINPDVILSSANHLNLLLSIFRWMFPQRIKIIARESSIVSINTKHAKFSALYDRLLKMFYKHIDLIVCQSKFMLDDLITHYNIKKEKTVVIYNPVEMPKQVSANSGGESRLVTVGRLSPEKGIDRLIKAVSYLKIPYHFTIIGDGSQKQELQALVSSLGLTEKITFAGVVSNPFDQQKNADLFLMGSHYEGFPNALLEATAAGIPVVAFNAPGGIAEVVVPGENGLLVDSNAVEDLAKAIEKALGSDFNRNMIRMTTMVRFETPKIIQQWESLFEAP